MGYGASGSADYSHSKINADYAAVTEQSGLLAGDGGYQVNVAGHTQLTGAIITSTEKAEKEHKNQLSTGTIGFSDLHNHSDYKGEGFGIGVSGDYGGGADGKTVDKNGKPTSTLSSGIGYGHDSGHDNSTTHSGINTANITITDKEHQSQDINQLHTDVTTDNYTEHAGYIGNNFDKDKVQHELDTQIDVSKEFSQNTQKVQAEIGKKKDQLKEQLEHETDPEKQQQYQDQIINLDKVNVLISMVSGGLSAPTSNVGGIIAATASPALAYEIGQHFKENGTEGSAEHLLAHAVLGAAVAAAGGNNALVGAVSAAGGEAAAPALAHWLYGKEPSDLTAGEKQTVSSIVGLAGAAVGAATGNSADIVSSAQIGQNAVDNNNFVLQAQFVITHPVIAYRIGSVNKDPSKDKNPNISTIASTFELNLFNLDDYKMDNIKNEFRGEGGIGNAYRHTLWQAIITNEFGTDIAMEAGNAHESFWGTNFNKNKGLSLDEADELADQLNNRIGRSISKNYPKSTNKQLAEYVLKEFGTNGLYRAIKNKDGSYDVVRKPIPDNVYQQSKQKLNILDQTGAGPAMQKKRKNRK